MIRRYLIAGFITLLPSVVTLWLLRVIFSSLVDIFRTPVTWISTRMHLPEPAYWELAIISALATLLLLFLVGMAVGNFLGRYLLDLMDEVMSHVPVLKGVYGATKQLMNAIKSGRGGSFKEVVLVEWPQAGSYTLGFVARHDCSWAMENGQNMVAVYIPTAPNPTSGYVIMLDQSKVRPLNIRPEQAFTWAVSGGVVAPGLHEESSRG
jgi:uncharacterized membrane protein